MHNLYGNVIKKDKRIYPVPQGACSDGKYIYMIVEKKKPHRCRIVKLLDGKVVKISKPMGIGHGNDVCYWNGKLYITHSSGKKVIHVVDCETLKKQKNIKVKWCCNGIARCNHGFLLREMGGSNIIIVNNKFKKKGSFKSKGVDTSQGMCFRGKSLYRSFSDYQSKDKNVIREYDLKGKKLAEKRLKVTGELECVFFHNGKMLVVVYVKKKKAYIYEVTEWAK